MSKDRTTINFGVYKGMPWNELPENYLYWLANTAKSNPVVRMARDEIDRRDRVRGGMPRKWGTLSTATTRVLMRQGYDKGDAPPSA